MPLTPLKTFPRRAIGKIFRIAQRRAANDLERRLNASVDSGSGRFIIATPELKVHLWKCEDARLILHGDVIIRSDLGGDQPVRISICRRGSIEIGGEFVIGDGVRMMVSEGASLRIGGRKNESGSGITCNTKILATNSIDIGTDFICAWDVCITDSDHHYIEGQPPSIPVRIGDHCWIGFGAAVLKGSNIGDGGIVAAHSLVHKQTFPPQSLIAGIPAKLARASVVWARDIPTAL
jgi:acetyltransferase-like isoleucine patch superfamily enzyme